MAVLECGCAWPTLDRCHTCETFEAAEGMNSPSSGGDTSTWVLEPTRMARHAEFVDGDAENTPPANGCDNTLEL